MKTPNIVIFIGLATMLILGALCAAFSYEGFRHIDAQSTARIALEELKAGRLLEGSIGLANAWRMTIDGGARWVIARPYINAMIYNEKRGDLFTASYYCRQAVSIIRRYDDEGSLSYECVVLDERIRRNSP